MAGKEPTTLKAAPTGSTDAGHIIEGIMGMNNESFGAEGPFQSVELDDEGIGEDNVVVDELAVLVAGAFGDAPAHDALESTRQVAFKFEITCSGD